MVVARPNYGTNIETPRAIGADISYLDQVFEESYRVDTRKLESLIRPDTRYISLTNPHNPTGTMMTLAELEAAVAIAEKTRQVAPGRRNLPRHVQGRKAAGGSFA